MLFALLLPVHLRMFQPLREHVEQAIVIVLFSGLRFPVLLLGLLFCVSLRGCILPDCHISMCTRAHTHTHTHTHACTHTYAHTHTYTRTYTDINNALNFKQIGTHRADAFWLMFQMQENCLHSQYCYAPSLLGGGIKRCFCLTSVCLTPDDVTSVKYIGSKSRTERPRKTKIATEVADITRDSDTTFKVKRSKVKVTRPLWLAVQVIT